jgi:hypothetical protein
MTTEPRCRSPQVDQLEHHTTQAVHVCFQVVRLTSQNFLIVSDTLFGPNKLTGAK